MILTVGTSQPFSSKPLAERGHSGFYFAWGWFDLWLAPGSLTKHLAHGLPNRTTCEATRSYMKALGVLPPFMESLSDLWAGHSQRSHSTRTVRW